MAFHPFRSFQKHQKAWLAGVTILAMITFIACGSGSLVGDFGGWVQNLFGGKGKQPIVAKIAGKNYTYNEIQELQQRRRLANGYMAAASDQAAQNVLEDITKSSATFDETQQRELKMLLQAQQGRMIDMLVWKRTHTVFQKSEAVLRGEINFAISTLRSMYKELADANKTEQARKVRDLMAVLGMDLWSLQRPGNEMYFGGTLSLDDSLDFLIWRDQADKLGIALTDADIKAAFNHETLGRFTKENAEKLEQNFEQARMKINLDTLYAALGDEFRVRLAQGALLGYDSGPLSYQEGGVSLNEIPTAITPYEFWKFYRDNRTTVKVAMQPVPVQDFLAQVTAAPEDKELRSLFNRYKDQEPAPYRDKPGFKQPRRVQVEWVSGRADTPGRLKEAERVEAVANAASQVAAGVVGHAFEGGVVASAVPALLPSAFDVRLLHEYDRNRYEFQLASWTNPYFALGFYTAKTRPEDVVSAIGQAQGAAFQLPFTYQAAAFARDSKEQAPAIAREAKVRIPVGLSLILAGADGSPWNAAGWWYHANQEPQQLPLEAVKDQLQAKVREKLARSILLSTLNTLKKDVETHKGKPEEERKLVAKAVKDYDLKHQTTEKPRDKFNLGDDPGLKPLKEAYERESRRLDPKAKKFADLFFDNQGTYSPQQVPSTSLEGPLDRPWWESAEEPFLYWRTEDQRAYVPQKIELVRDQVVAAWKFQKARDLARKEAERLEAELRARKGKAEAAAGAEPFLRDEGAKHPKWGMLIELDNIARLVDTNVATVGAKQYEPYKVPEELIAYPRADLVEKLLSLKETGDATVVSDRPEAIFYVTVLLRRSVPTEEDFYQVYKKTPMFDSLFLGLEQERRKQYREAFMKQLRSAAGQVDDQGKLVVDEDSRKGLDVRGGESDE